MDEAEIKVENVSKVFKLPHEKNTSVKSAVVNFYRRNKGYDLQRALNNVSLEVKKGEFLGIVGRNGSGKSTLLKMLAGIYSPTEGTITVNGTLTPFIELGVGFNAELTGRENVFLNGALLGFNRKEMRTMYKDIVSFAELEKFMDQKLKNYSSGMQVRLAFSIAIRAKSDILLIDEVLAVGDSAFQRKCFDHFDRLKKDKRTVVLVTHDMGAVEKYCDRAVLIDDGNLLMEGEPRMVAARYRLINLAVGEDAVETLKLRGGVKIKSVKVNGLKEASVNAGKDITIEIDFMPQKTQKYVLAVSIYRDDNTHVAYYDNSEAAKGTVFQKNKTYKSSCTFPASQFLGGVYKADIEVYNDDDEFLVRRTNAVRFAINNKIKSKAGIFNLNGEWRLGKD